MPGIVQQVGSNPFCIPLIIYIYIHGIYTGSTIYIYIQVKNHSPFGMHIQIFSTVRALFFSFQICDKSYQIFPVDKHLQCAFWIQVQSRCLSLPLSLSPSLQPNIFVLRRRWFTYFTQWYRVVLSRDFPKIPQCSMFASDALFHFRRQHSKLMHNPHICHACCLVLI